jgi:hypothetical protein
VRYNRVGPGTIVLFLIFVYFPMHGRHSYMCRVGFVGSGTGTNTYTPLFNREAIGHCDFHDFVTRALVISIFLI